MSDVIVDTIRAKLNFCLKQFVFGLSAPDVLTEIEGEVLVALSRYSVLQFAFDVTVTRVNPRRIQVKVRFLHPTLSTKHKPVLLNVFAFADGTP